MNPYFMSNDCVSGFTDAEGCFSIHVTKDRWINVTFAFTVSQSDEQPLNACANALVRYGALRGVTVGTYTTYDDGVASLNVGQHESLMDVIRPFFQDHPLNSSKRQDYHLFFVALAVYMDKTRDRYVG